MCPSFKYFALAPAPPDAAGVFRIALGFESCCGCFDGCEEEVCGLEEEGEEAGFETAEKESEDVVPELKKF
jgi:hypothetical protein